MPSRWDFLLDQKPVPIKTQLFVEVAKQLGKELGKWPLPVVELDPVSGQKFAELLTAESKRPSDAAFEEAFRIARWELERQVDAIDDYMRNRRWLEREGLGPSDQLSILFISRWLVEQLLALREETQSRVTRAELVTLVDDVAREWSFAGPQLRPQ